MPRWETVQPVSPCCAFTYGSLDETNGSAAEILKEVKPFIEEGVGAHIIIKGLRMARDLVS